jgi:hypothetical protein
VNLYKLSQRETRFHSYDSCVVAAASEQDARETHPNLKGCVDLLPGEAWWAPCDFPQKTWAAHPGDVVVQYLGKAGPKIEAGVICASWWGG